MAEANTPSWLSDNNNNFGGGSTGGDVLAADTNNAVATTSPSPLGISTTNGTNASNDDDDPDLPGVILTMRLANIGVAVTLIVYSVC